MAPTDPKSGPLDTTTRGSLQKALYNSAAAASARAKEGEQIFSPLAGILDDYLKGEALKTLSPHLRKALTSLCEDITTVACRHFDAYIRGSTRSPKPYTVSSRHPSPASLSAEPTSDSDSSSTPASSAQSLPKARGAYQAPTNPPSSSASSTYAGALKSKTPAPTHPAPKGTKQRKAPPPPPDNRLFIRLPPDSQTRSLGPYALLTVIRARLTNPEILREVQSTKTGFALCPSSPDALQALEAQGEAITSVFGQCSIERATKWISYRITNIPRSIGLIGSNNIYTMGQVNPSLLSTAIYETTGITPTRVTETPASSNNPGAFSTSWFVNFPEESKVTLPRQLRILGAAASTRLLHAKVNAIQCGRCQNWHNIRSCARPPRCRLCGSTEHTEEGHTNHCNTPGSHTCPSRCVHCHGPHAADSPECLLRPNPNTPRTKAQIAEIRKTCSATRLRIRTEAGCTLLPSKKDQQEVSVEANDHMEDESPAPEHGLPLRPMTPPPPPAPTIPPTSTRPNRFALLEYSGRASTLRLQDEL